MGSEGQLTPPQSSPGALSLPSGLTCYFRRAISLKTETLSRGMYPRIIFRGPGHSDEFFLCQETASATVDVTLLPGS